MLFVVHDLDEVREITDGVTVLRDGRVHGTVKTAETSEGDIVEMIIGRRLAQLELHREDASTHATAISVEGMIGTKVRGLSLEVRAGEVLGVTGLLGSGFDELPYLLFGARPCFGGELRTEGATYSLASMTPQRALAAGISLIPADRQRDGSIGALRRSDQHDDAGARRLPADEPASCAASAARRASSATSSTCARTTRAATTQSLERRQPAEGAVAKWMQTEPQLLLLHEPTQGVDVGAREQIFRMLSAAAESGMSILCASSDYEQLAAICDRVLVLGNGQIVRELTGADVVKERIAEQVYNSVTLAEAG